MGADFLFITCPHFRPTSTRLKQLRRLVRELPTAEMAELAEYQGLQPAEITAGILSAIKQLPELDPGEMLATSTLTERSSGSPAD